MTTAGTPVTITNLIASDSSSGTVTGSTGGNATISTAFDYGIIMIDTTSPGISVPVGAENTDFDTLTHFKYESDVTRSVPLGRDLPISSYRRVKYRTAQREFMIPYFEYYGGVGLYGTDILTNLRLMSLSHNTVWYRDIRGISLFVTIDNFEEYVVSPVHFHVKLNLTECGAPQDFSAPNTYFY